jgi:ketosteroid isomerase-like protein
MGNLESVQAVYEAFGRGDVPAILEVLSDDVEWDEDAPAYGIPIYEPGAGKEHVKRFFNAVQEGLEFLRFEPTNFLSGGNQVAVPVNIEAKVKSNGNLLQALTAR